MLITYRQRYVPVNRHGCERRTPNYPGLAGHPNIRILKDILPLFTPERIEYGVN